MIFKKIRKGHADWRNFLCSTPAMDYVFQKDAYEDQIDRAAENIRNAGFSGGHILRCFRFLPTGPDILR